MNQRLWIFLAASALSSAVALGACGGDSLPSDTQSASSTGEGPTTTTTTTTAGSTTGGMGGAGSSSASVTGTGAGGGAGGAEPDCFTNPITHVEIINACTTADKVDKMSVLPLLGPNGELPPLP